MASPTQVRDLLDSLLAEAVSALETTEGAEVPPARQYIAHGIVTWDCDQLTANLVRVTPKFMDPRAERCAVFMQATMAVVLLRCVPTVDAKGDPPPAADLSAANRQLAIDGPAIQKHLTRAWATGAWPEGVPCHKVRFGALEPFAPSGGLAGWRIEVTVDLN